MGASESIYGARGVESSAAEPEGQLMHRTPLSLSGCATGPTVVGPAALEAQNLSATVPYVVELRLAPGGCDIKAKG